MHQGGALQTPTVEAVLAGAASYDDLTYGEQMMVRAAWETRDNLRLADLDFTRTCPDCGLSYVEAAASCGGHTPRT